MAMFLFLYTVAAIAYLVVVVNDASLIHGIVHLLFIAVSVFVAAMLVYIKNKHDDAKVQLSVLRERVGEKQNDKKKNMPEYGDEFNIESKNNMNIYNVQSEFRPGDTVYVVYDTGVFEARVKKMCIFIDVDEKTGKDTIHTMITCSVNVHGTAFTKNLYWDEKNTMFKTQEEAYLAYAKRTVKNEKA